MRVAFQMFVEKNKMKKSYKEKLLLLVFIIVYSILSAQKDTTIYVKADTSYNCINYNEINVFTSGGTSSYFNKMNFGEKGFGLSGSFGVNYTRFLNDNWGLFLGIECVQYNACTKFNNLRIAYLRHETEMEDPVNPENLIYYVDIWKMREKDTYTNLNIPFGVYFQLPLINKKHNFYNSLSVKLSIPVKTEYSVLEFSGRTWGYYYESTRQPLYDQEDLGFFPEIKTSLYNQKIDDINMSCFLSYETGIKWKLTNNLAFSTALFVDFGLNNIVKNRKNAEIVFYDGKSISFNSILNSNFTITDNFTQLQDIHNFANKFQLLAIGAKIALNFSFGKKSTTIR
jgi:hypothetical protein